MKCGSLFNDRGRPSERWQRVARTKIVELDALMERIRGMRELIVRRCQCADLDECGRRILVAQASELALLRNSVICYQAMHGGSEIDFAVQIRLPVFFENRERARPPAL